MLKITRFSHSIRLNYVNAYNVFTVMFILKFLNCVFLLLP